MIVMLCVTILAVGTVGYLVSGRAASTVADKSKKSFAVLPLKPIDVANRTDLYEIGAANAVIERLNSIDGFLARPLIATRKYTDLDQDPVVAGREQNVDYVLAPSYQSADGKIRLSTPLYNVSTGRIVENYFFEKEVSGVFSMQDAFAADLANKLMARFGTKPVGAPPNRGTDNEEAYGLYLQGMNLSEERVAQNVQKALGYLERAVSLDPKYARAWAGIAHLHRDIASSDVDQHEQYQKSMEAIQKALDIDPNLSDAYSARCQNKNRYEYDFAGAETDCKRALELEPNSPLAHKTYANFLYSRGRFDEAITEIKMAMELQPVSYRNQQMYGLTLFYARRYQEAEAQFKRLLELNPNQGEYIEGWLVTILEAEGKEPEAFEYLVKSLNTKKVDNVTIDRFKTVYARSGWRGVTMERIKTPEARRMSGPFQLACLYAKLGDKDRAFEYLEKAYQERSFLIAVLQVTPQLDPLRNDPRYADLVSRIERR